MNQATYIDDTVRALATLVDLRWRLACLRAILAARAAVRAANATWWWRRPRGALRTARTRVGALEAAYTRRYGTRPPRDDVCMAYLDHHAMDERTSNAKTTPPHRHY